jgi:phage tail-like protein
MPPTGQIVDPYLDCNFIVEIDGIVRAGFQEASGLDSTIDVTEYQEGGDKYKRKVPGQAKFSNIVLKWGSSTDHDLYDWHKQWLTGDPAAARKSGSIILRDRSGNEVIRWNFTRAWPTKWTGPTFNAIDSKIAIESIEMAHEGVFRAA